MGNVFLDEVISAIEIGMTEQDYLTPCQKCEKRDLCEESESWCIDAIKGILGEDKTWKPRFPKY